MRGCEPTGFIATAEHVATNARWSAERGRVCAEGNDLAVFRIPDQRVTEAWFFADGYDPHAVSEVSSFASGE